MTPVYTGSADTQKSSIPIAWGTIAWVTALLVACYLPVLIHLVSQWATDADMGHGFFVPVIAGYIAWQKRDQIADKLPKANWWGLAIMIWAAFQLYIAKL